MTDRRGRGVRWASDDGASRLNARGRTRTLIRRLAIALILLLPGAAHAALPGLEATTVDDPVFGGRAVVYSNEVDSDSTVVLVHGLGTEGAAVWSSLVGAIGDERRIVALDLPGFGRSDSRNALYSPQRYAEYLAFTLDRFNVERAMLVGHSLGGAVSLLFADRYPERVERLLLVDVAGILHRSAYLSYLARTGSSDDGGLRRPDNPLDRLVGKLIRKADRHGPSPSTVLGSATLRRLLLGGKPRRIAAAALAETDFSEAVAGTAVPTTLYWGRHDNVAPIRVGYVLAARMPDARLMVFEEAGHAPMLDVRERFNAEVRGWLAQTATREPGPEGRSPGPGDTDAECRNEAGRTFTGRYDTLFIERCRNVLLEDVTAHRIVIRASNVAMVDVHVDGGGLRLERSDVVMTVGSVSGETAVVLAGSRLDVAGTRITGRQAAIRGAADGSASEVTFSVTPVTTDGQERYLHEVRAIRPGASL